MTSVEENISATPSANEELSVNSKAANEENVDATPATNELPVKSEEDKESSVSSNELLVKCEEESAVKETPELIKNGENENENEMGEAPELDRMPISELVVTGTDESCEDVKNFNPLESMMCASEIKQEDPLDINEEETTQAERMPKISLTPAAKLMAIKPAKNCFDPKRKFVCPYENCGKSYGKSSHLRSHLTWHTGIKPFVCQEPNCGKGFTRSDELNRHVRTHTGEKPFECVQCTKKFSRSDHLTKHLATHLKQHKTTKRNSNNAKNSANNTNNGNNSRNSNNRSSVNESTRADDAVSPNEEDSKKQFKRTHPEVNNEEHTGHAMTTASVEHKRHLRGDNNTEIFSAKELFKVNVESERRSKRHGTPSPPFVHLPIKLKLERPENGKDYQIVPTGILKNTGSPHDNFGPTNSDAKSEFIVGDDEIMPEANLPPFIPNVDVIIKDEPIDPELETETSTTDGRPFRCEICYKSFRRETDLNRHRHVHPSSGNEYVPPPTLNGSNETISVQPDMDSYITDGCYDPSRPFYCTECTKNFRRQDDLNRHMRTHTGEKPYACNECDRRFVRSDHLKKHMLTHTRVR